MNLFDKTKNFSKYLKSPKVRQDLWGFPNTTHGGGAVVGVR